MSSTTKQDITQSNLISELRNRIELVSLGDRKAPQSVFSKEQISVLQAVTEAPLSLDEKNSLLRYLYLNSVAYSRCLESDIAKEIKQKAEIKKENEKLRERVTKLTELNTRYQELNTTLTNEIELIKGKEKDLLLEEKRMREHVMDQFMVSLDELNVKVEDHSRANATLLEENRTLREEYKEKIARFHEQALASKEIIAKLSEMNSLYEKQVNELTYHLQVMSIKAKEGEELKKTISDYTDLAKKQSEVISNLKDHRDNLKKVVNQYESALGTKNSDLKTKNRKVNEMEMENAALRKELKQQADKLQKMEKICRYLQSKVKEEEVSEDELLWKCLLQK